MSKLEVNAIDSVGSTLTLGDTNATTLALNSSITTLPSALKNTPAFMAVQGSDQTVATSTFSKCQLSVVKYDTASAFDNTTNYRWTVPSGGDGTYVFLFNVYCYYIDSGQRVEGRIYKNGSNAGSGSTEGSSTFRFQAGSAGTEVNSTGIWSDALVAGDYIELYVNQVTGSNQTLDRSTFLMGYKLIGA